MSVHHIQRPAGGEPAVATNNQPVSEHGALGWLPRTCFRTGPSHRTGLELELLLMTSGPAGDHVPTTERITLMADLHILPLSSRLTVEPGGQIELSSPPAADVAGAAGHLGHDLALVRRRVEWHGLRLVGSGLDPCRAPRRVLEGPRYAAMETYFDRRGVAGRLMMCSTASVQVNVEAGSACGDDISERWHLLHAIGPTLVAAFANSPLSLGRPSGWAGTRQAVWQALDARRTRAAPAQSIRVRANRCLTPTHAGAWTRR